MYIAGAIEPEIAAPCLLGTGGRKETDSQRYPKGQGDSKREGPVFQEEVTDLTDDG